MRPDITVRSPGARGEEASRKWPGNAFTSAWARASRSVSPRAMNKFCSANDQCSTMVRPAALGRTWLTLIGSPPWVKSAVKASEVRTWVGNSCWAHMRELSERCLRPNIEPARRSSPDAVRLTTDGLFRQDDYSVTKVRQRTTGSISQIRRTTHRRHATDHPPGRRHAPQTDIRPSARASRRISRCRSPA